MAILKKILAVFGILSVLVCAVVVPCSALGVGGGSSLLNEDYCYLYAPIQVDVIVNSRDIVEPFTISLAQNERERNGYGVSFYHTDDADNTMIVEMNNLFTPRNGGYSGRTDFTFKVDSGTQDYSISFVGFSLPSVWSARGLKMGSETYSPRVNREGGFAGVYDMRYTGTIYNATNGAKIEIDKVVQCNGSALVFPPEVQTVITNTGWSNYILFDYKATIASGAPTITTNETISIIQPSNGGAVRFTPFASEYGESYIDKIISENVVVVDQSFDFTSWLGDAFGFLDVPLFGNFTIGGLLSVVIGISLFLAFLKIFAGG